MAALLSPSAATGEMNNQCPFIIQMKRMPTHGEISDRVNIGCRYSESE